MPLRRQSHGRLDDWTIGRLDDCRLIRYVITQKQRTMEKPVTARQLTFLVKYGAPGEIDTYNHPLSHRILYSCALGVDLSNSAAILWDRIFLIAKIGHNIFVSLSQK